MASTPDSAASTASSTVWIPLRIIGPFHTERIHSTSSHDRPGSNCAPMYSARLTGSVPSPTAPPTTLAKRIGSERTKRQVHPGCSAPSTSVPGPDRRREREPASHVALTPTEHGRVDREHECLVAGVCGAVDHLLDQAAVAPHVDLEPLRTTRRRWRPPRSSGCSASTTCTELRPAPRPGRPPARPADRRSA